MCNEKLSSFADHTDVYILLSIESTEITEWCNACPYSLALFFYAPEIEDVFVLSVILLFCPPFRNFNFAYNFWTVSARALIFHMSIPCVKTFQCVSTFFTLWPWSWRLTLFYNFNVGNNFWTVGSRALVFHMCILWDKTFQWVPTILTLWPWSLTYFLKKC